MTALETDRLIIREIIEEDIPHLYEYGQLDIVTRHQNWGPSTFEDVKRIYESSIKDRKQDPRLSFFLVIALKSNQQVIGDIGHFIENKQLRRTEIGYNINPKYWKNGYATEATKKLIEHILESYKDIEIIATCNQKNIGSQNVLTKCGLKHIRTKLNEETRKGLVNMMVFQYQ